jgi:hypothetical protein
MFSYSITVGSSNGKVRLPVDKKKGLLLRLHHTPAYRRLYDSRNATGSIAGAQASIKIHIIVAQDANIRLWPRVYQFLPKQDITQLDCCCSPHLSPIRRRPFHFQSVLGYNLECLNESEKVGRVSTRFSLYNSARFRDCITNAV